MIQGNLDHRILLQWDQESLIHYIRSLMLSFVSPGKWHTSIFKRKRKQCFRENLLVDESVNFLWV